MCIITYGIIYIMKTMYPPGYDGFVTTHALGHCDDNRKGTFSS